MSSGAQLPPPANLAHVLPPAFSPVQTPFAMSSTSISKSKSPFAGMPHEGKPVQEGRQTKLTPSRALAYLQPRTLRRMGYRVCAPRRSPSQDSLDPNLQSRRRRQLCTRRAADPRLSCSKTSCSAKHIAEVSSPTGSAAPTVCFTRTLASFVPTEVVEVVQRPHENRRKACFCLGGL